MMNESELSKQKALEREAKELLTVEQQKLEGEQERRKGKKRILEMELQTKETEVENMKVRLQKEREEYEADFRDRQMRDLKIYQIRLEERRENLALAEQELRQKWRMLEKKKEILQRDFEQLQIKNEQLVADKREFEDWANKIRETSIKLAEERDVVQQEKAQYDFERETLEKAQMEIDL